MILCKWKKHWYIAIRSQANPSRIVLRTGRNMPCEEGFKVSLYGTHQYRAVDIIEEIIYFPEIRYKGIRVYPCHWSETATDPLLWCLVMQDAIVAAIGIDGYDDFIKRMIREENWQWDIREDGGREFHVDELEKIEGPPKGAF